MPIPRRQFIVGAVADVEPTMRRVYELLASMTDLAFTSEEIQQKVGDTKVNVERALDALVELYVVDTKQIEGSEYFILRRFCDTRTWEPLLEVPRALAS